jgi:hypothetical protein
MTGLARLAFLLAVALLCAAPAASLIACNVCSCE